MPGREYERSLLFGLLALQNHFVDRDGLVAAFNAWLGDRSRPIDRILVDRGLIGPDLRALVVQLVDRLIATSPETPPAPESPPDESTHAYFSDLAAWPLPRRTDACDRDDAGPDPTGSAVAEIGSVDGRFGLLRFHARGGLGEVYVARDGQLNREVALKVIQEPYADHRQSRERFLREAEITGRLEHPGVVPVYALGENSRGQPYYAMRFIRGRSLDAEIAEFHDGGPDGRPTGSARVLALRALLGRFLAACDAAAYAHSRGVVHRDLKPANVMLGPFGETLVVDWGLAKPVGRVGDPEPSGHSDEGTLRPSSGDGSAETVPGAVQGTPAFMSPEQARGENDRLGQACDVYSLGATLYQILAGRPPFRGSKEDVLPRVMVGDFPPPRQVAPEVPRALEAVCLKAMRLRPGDRYPRVSDLAEEVRHWLADEPVAALPESAAQKVGRWARRNRAQARAAVLALLAVAVVSTFAALATLTALRNENRALDRASKSLDAERRAAGQARDSAARANRNLEVARKAVVGLLNGLAEGTLATLPQVGRLRAEVSQSASGFIDELLASNPNDLALRRGAALVYRERANIARGRREFDRAEAAYARATGLLEGFGPSEATEADRLTLVSVLSDSAEALRMANRRAEAAARFRASLDLLAEIRAGASKEQDAPLRRREAAARVDLGELLVDSGRPADAAVQYQAAVDALAPLASVARPALADVLVTALARLGLGGAWHELGRRDDAGRVLDDTARPLAGRGDNNSRFILAAVRSRQGEILADSPGSLADAERRYGEAVDLASALVTEFREQANYQLLLATALNGRGDVRIALGPTKAAEAEADSRRALEVLEAAAPKFAEDPTYHSQLGLTLDNLARLARGRDASQVGSFRERAGKAHEKAGELNPDRPVFQRRLNEHRKQAGT